jgi:hypothetical protein
MFYTPLFSNTNSYKTKIKDLNEALNVRLSETHINKEKQC